VDTVALKGPRSGSGSFERSRLQANLSLRRIVVSSVAFSHNFSLQRPVIADYAAALSSSGGSRLCPSGRRGVEDVLSNLDERGLWKRLGLANFRNE